MKKWRRDRNFSHRSGQLRVIGIYIVILLLCSATFATMGPLVVAGSEGTNEQGSPVEQWNRTYGGANYDEISASVQTEDGYLLAGTTSSLGAGGTDAWLVKIDENGTELWNRTYGTDDNDRVRALIRTSDNGYLLVGSAGALQRPSDGWVLKVDMNGTELWNRTYGGTGWDRFSAVVDTADGGYLLAGQVERSEEGVPDAWLVKIGDDGEESWNETFGGTGYDIATSVVRTPEGYAFAGYTRDGTGTPFQRWLVAVDDSGVEQWNQTYESVSSPILPLFAPLSLVKTESGFILAGSTFTSEVDLYLNVSVMQVDNVGTRQWSQTYNIVGDDYLTTMAVTSEGEIVVAGYGADDSELVFEPDFDAWAMKLTADGQVQWIHTDGDAGYDSFVTVLSDETGYLLGGVTTPIDATATESDGYVVRLETERNASSSPSGAPMPDPNRQ